MGYSFVVLVALVILLSVKKQVYEKTEQDFAFSLVHASALLPIEKPLRRIAPTIARVRLLVKSNVLFFAYFVCNKRPHIAGCDWHDTYEVCTCGVLSIAPFLHLFTF